MPRVYRKKTREERQAYYLETYGEQTINLVRKRYERGAKLQQVVKPLGWARCHGYRLVHVFGWKRRPGIKPARYKEPWTWGDMTQLRKMMEAGKSLADMAEALGRTVYSLRKMMDEVPAQWTAAQHKYWTGSEDRQLQVLYKRGIHLDLIAETLDRTVSSCRVRLHNLDCRRGKWKPWTPAQERRLYYLRQHTDKNYEQISFSMDRTIKACKERLILIRRRVRAGEFFIDEEAVPMAIESMFDGPGPGDPAPEGAQTCRECGCWQMDACWDEDKGPCGWAEEDLCTHCVKEEAA